jgi:hypothetical protein
MEMRDCIHSYYDALGRPRVRQCGSRLPRRSDWSILCLLL